MSEDQSEGFCQMPGMSPKAKDLRVQREKEGLWEGQSVHLSSAFWFQPNPSQLKDAGLPWKQNLLA